MPLSQRIDAWADEALNRKTVMKKVAKRQRMIFISLRLKRREEICFQTLLFGFCGVAALMLGSIIALGEQESARGNDQAFSFPGRVNE
jgi:hypothetical protein